MTAGRPTEYSQEVLDKTYDYLNRAWIEAKDEIQTIAGLALFLKISRDTIYDWSSQEDKKEFSDIVKNILSEQEKTLVNKGLNGKFNASITKLMLTKHGYSDKQELMGKDGEKLELGVVILPKRDESTLGSPTKTENSS